VQYLLYAALLAQPVVGVLMVWGEGSPVILFGSLHVPTLLPISDEVGEVFDRLHYYVGWGLIWLATLHAAAALRHHFLSGDDVLNRMLPAGGTARSDTPQARQ
jgi:cytochrome b561